MTDPDYRALCAELIELSSPVDSISQLAERLQKLNELADRARLLMAEPDGPAVPDGREPASVTDQLNYQLYRRAKILFVRKVIDQALRDTASVQWRVADTGEQLVRATDLLAWAEHMEKQMEQLDD